MMDGITIIERIQKRGALIKVLDKAHLDLTTPIGRGFIAFLSALAEDERQRIVKRANDGRKVARAKGVKFGRKPKLTEHQQEEALQRLNTGEFLPEDRQEPECQPCHDFPATGGLEAQTRRTSDASIVSLADEAGCAWPRTILERALNLKPELKIVPGIGIRQRNGPPAGALLTIGAEPTSGASDWRLLCAPAWIKARPKRGFRRR